MPSRSGSASCRPRSGTPWASRSWRSAFPSAGGTLVGTLDLGSEDVIHRLDAAQRLGRSGHAELVGPNGIELASTETGATLAPGEHLAFYRKMLKASQPGIADVPVTANQGEPAELQRAKHVMAFVRLSTAPWGVALGGTDSETYAPARQLRRTLLLAGGGALVAALAAHACSGLDSSFARSAASPSAAEEMASGNLDRTVSVSEGGEIGVLAESLEAMRAQLKDSLETVRRWGEELELKVGARTAELNARNRQLAAVSAIMAAANESHDLEGMLHRCLDVVLGQTAMDAAAVRAARRPRPAGETSARDGGLPLLDLHRGVLPPRQPLYLAQRVATSRLPLTAEALAILPLRGPSGVLGDLTLGRRDGRVPTPEERADPDGHLRPDRRRGREHPPRRRAPTAGGAARGAADAQRADLRRLARAAHAARLHQELRDDAAARGHADRARRRDGTSSRSSTRRQTSSST